MLLISRNLSISSRPISRSGRIILFRFIGIPESPAGPAPLTSRIKRVSAWSSQVWASAPCQPLFQQLPSKGLIPELSRGFLSVHAMLLRKRNDFNRLNMKRIPRSSQTCCRTLSLQALSRSEVMVNIKGGYLQMIFLFSACSRCRRQVESGPPESRQAQNLPLQEDCFCE